MFLMETLLQDIMRFFVVTINGNKELIHLGGGLLDHVYLLKLFPKMNANLFVKNIYFSDHNVVKLQIMAQGNVQIDFKRNS